MKKLISFVMIAALMICFCACGEQAPVIAEQKNNENDTVTVWVVDTITDHDEGINGKVEYDAQYTLRELECEATFEGETLKLRHSYCFDAAGRLITEGLQYLGGPYIDEGVHYFTYSYDLYGNRIEEDTVYFYDDNGRIIMEENDYCTTQYTYDAKGNLIIETSRYDEDVDVTTYKYDENGNCIEVISGWGGITTYTYDEQGREIADNNIIYPTTTEYDKNGNVFRIRMNGNEGVVFTYKQVTVTPEQAEIIKEQQKCLWSFDVLWS